MKKLITILVLLICNGIHAFPQGNSFTYQGELFESGQPANGSYTFNVHFYDSSTGGNLLDSNSNLITNVENGLFSLELDISDAPFQGDEVWIELEVVIIVRGVGTNETLSPRQLITNAPYAIQSKYVGNGGVSTLSINNNAVTSSKLASASVTNSKLAINSVNSSNIINESIDTDDIKNGTIMAVDVNSSSIQQRISGTCSAGSSIRSIAENGMVTCEPDSVGSGSGWELTGNAGTDPLTNFIGTTDNKPFIVKVNNKQVLKIQEANNQMPGVNHMNVVLGAAAGSIDQFAGSKLENAMILGGSNNAILTLTASDSSENSVVVGGTGNFIKDANESIIVGGANSAIEKLGYRSAIISGTGSNINASYSFASGFGSTISHNGSWVWNDFSSFDTSNSFATTAENQFLIRAEGGFGLGTNAPVSPMHVKGQGTSTGSVTGSNEVVLTLEPKAISDNVAMVINRPTNSEEASLIFSATSNPEFDIRTPDTRAGYLEFNAYESGTTKQTLMAFDYFSSPTISEIEMSAHVLPSNSNTFNLGSAGFKWASIDATNINSVNPVNVTSDRRLKENIKELQYGISEILSLKPVSYTLKNTTNQKRHLGLIAQDVELVFPEIVNKGDDEKHTRSMRYTELVPVLIKATQEQQVLIDQQNRQIKALQILVNKLVKNNSNRGQYEKN